MRIETALRTIADEVQTLRALNDRLMDANRDLERQVDQARHQERIDVRRAYRLGYRAGHATGRAGRAANPRPEASARGDVGRLVRPTTAETASAA